jgi:hypothetical protein
MKTKLWIMVAVAVVVLGGLGVLNFSANADSKYERSSLVGLAGVHVVVERLNPSLEIENLNKTAIKKDIETMITSAGIKSLTEKQMFDTPGMPYLYVNLSTAKRGPAYAYHVHIEVRQGTFLERDMKLAVTSTTWNGTGITGVVAEDEIAVIRTAVENGVHEFIKAYVEANQIAADGAAKN